MRTVFEIPLKNSAFFHGRTHGCDLKTALDAMNAQLKTWRNQKYNGIILDTCTNSSSLIGKPRYQAYKRQFGLKKANHQASNRPIRGIGGMRE